MKTLFTILLLAQFTMTPERKAAMDEASVNIRSLSGKITQAQAQEQHWKEVENQLSKDKTTAIITAKTKLGLDATWNWDDKTNTFIQTTTKK